uniref:Uncharacterized protein n=1 Tax=Anguilla anguilla TaxID=7936 RepID=A0A0E9WBG3_ANGAN
MNLSTVSLQLRRIKPPHTDTRIAPSLLPISPSLNSDSLASPLALVF